jgi:hypothetical protein
VSTRAKGLIVDRRGLRRASGVVIRQWPQTPSPRCERVYRERCRRGLTSPRIRPQRAKFCRAPAQSKEARSGPVDRAVPKFPTARRGGEPAGSPRALCRRRKPWLSDARSQQQNDRAYCANRNARLSERGAVREGLWLTLTRVRSSATIACLPGRQCIVPGRSEPGSVGSDRLARRRCEDLVDRSG